MGYVYHVNHKKGRGIFNLMKKMKNEKINKHVLLEGYEQMSAKGKSFKHATDTRASFNSFSKSLILTWR